MISNIIRTKHESQEKGFRLQYLGYSIVVLLFFLFTVHCNLSTVYAISDPLAVPNNKFGIHIISPSIEESSPAASLVNSKGGDWGYVTVLVESGSRDHNKWQNFFDDLRRRHLIPLVRLATQPDGDHWKIPYEGEEDAWAGFLDNLNWPTKNRYIVIYNEPNQGQEWAGSVNAKSYAKVLDKTITALKNKNSDFFVLNAGLDASAPQKPPKYEDETNFLKEMNEEVPGIFNKLDGWVSHSYPNPGFAGSPDAEGKGTVRTWEWELQKLKELGLAKNLPVFITETGWKHAEGLDFDKSLPSSDTLGEYFKTAFQNAWADSRIIAVTPFLLNYQEAPFDHFSFKKLTGEKQNMKILGASYPEYYPHYQALLDLPKISGKPIQENKAGLVKGGLYPSIVSGEKYTIPLTFKNTGQSIWNEYEKIELRNLNNQKGLNFEAVSSNNQKIEPGKEVIFNVHLQASSSDTFRASLQLFVGNKAFDQKPLEFTIQAKSPVLLSINTGLLWKKNFAGEYLLSVTSDVLNNTSSVNINDAGKSDILETRYLLPDHTFQFTLYKKFYRPKTISLTVNSGVNLLSFDKLEPDFLAALFKPLDFWKLLPWSN